MDFVPSSITLTGQIRLTAPIVQVFPLFSPLGEKLWVPGWNPELLFPPNIEWTEGQLFRTQEEVGSAIWVVSQLDLKAYRVVYHRFEAGRYVAQIVVRCIQASADVTEVAIVFCFVGLSDPGNQEINAMSQHAYEEKMARLTLCSERISRNLSGMNTHPKINRVSPSQAWLGPGAGLLCGALVWWLSVPFNGVREPFDSASLYYPIAMFLAGIFATLPAPRYWWIAVVGIFLGEWLYAFMLLPETRAWLPFGMVINVLIFSWVPAALGAVSVYFIYHQFKKRVGRQT